MKSKEAKTWAEIRNQATDNIMGHFALLRKVTILRTEFVSTPLTRKVESHLPHLSQFSNFLLTDLPMQEETAEVETWISSPEEKMHSRWN